MTVCEWVGALLGEHVCLCVCVCVHAHVCMTYSMWCLILVYCLAVFCTNTVFSADLVLFEGQEAFFKVRSSSCGDSVLFALVSTKASATYFFCTVQYTSPRARHTFVLYPFPPLTLPLPSPSVHSSSPSLCPLLQVSLALLTLHEDSLLQCDSMESISEYIKEAIPDTALNHLPYILSYSLKVSPDFSLKLKRF